MHDLPTGTISFLFTDIEGSTARWEPHPQVMHTTLARYATILHQIISVNGGLVFKMTGDAIYAAFAIPSAAISAAVAAQQALAAKEWDNADQPHVRMALHTGTAQCRDNDYFGSTLNRVAHLLSTGHGDQILLSTVTYELVRDNLPAGVSVKDMGEHALKDLLRHEHIYQLVAPDLPTEFPPLRSLEGHANNLPTQPTAFVGREREMMSVCALLRQPQTCLVTLTGPGGIGKTRLSLHVATELVDQFTDGVFLVPLAPVSGTAEPRICLAHVAVLQGEWMVALRCYQECLAMLHQFGIMIYFPAYLEGLGSLATALKMPEKAARLWGKAEAMREELGALMYPVDRPEYERAVADARTYSGKEAFVAAWAEGKTAPLEQIIDEILKMDGEAGKQ